MSTIDPTTRIYVDQSSGCHIWTGSIDKKGYGKATGGLAHRIIYESAIGPIPKGYELHHRCENPRCCNPEHLVPSTRKHHIRFGGKAKLTPESVKKIRELKGVMKQRELAEMFGVSRSAINEVQRMANWTDPDDLPLTGRSAYTLSVSENPVS